MAKKRRKKNKQNQVEQKEPPFFQQAPIPKDPLAETAELEAEQVADKMKKGEKAGPIKALTFAQSNNAPPKKSSGGHTLPGATLLQMEDTFGRSFSDVQVHTNSEADQRSRQLNARAFTFGKNIYFKSGQYQPEKTKGQHLIAHELTHVVQQNNQAVVQRSGDETTTTTTETVAHEEVYSFSGLTVKLDKVNAANIAKIKKTIRDNHHHLQRINRLIKNEECKVTRLKILGEAGAGDRFRLTDGIPSVFIPESKALVDKEYASSLLHESLHGWYYDLYKTKEKGTEQNKTIVDNEGLFEGEEHPVKDGEHLMLKLADFSLQLGDTTKIDYGKEVDEKGVVISEGDRQAMGHVMIDPGNWGQIPEHPWHGPDEFTATLISSYILEPVKLKASIAHYEALDKSGIIAKNKTELLLVVEQILTQRVPDKFGMSDIGYPSNQVARYSIPPNDTF